MLCWPRGNTSSFPKVRSAVMPRLRRMDGSSFDNGTWVVTYNCQNITSRAFIRNQSTHKQELQTRFSGCQCQLSIIYIWPNLDQIQVTVSEQERRTLVRWSTGSSCILVAMPVLPGNKQGSWDLCLVWGGGRRLLSLVKRRTPCRKWRRSHNSLAFFFSFFAQKHITLPSAITEYNKSVDCSMVTGMHTRDTLHKLESFNWISLLGVMEWTQRCFPQI